MITRILLTVAVAYLAIIVILWVFQARFLYPAPQGVVPLTPGYEEVMLQTEDGLSLRAFYREAREGFPTAVYFHGNGGSLSGASVSNAPLVAAGIGALLVEYRGYGGNPGEPSEEGFYQDGEAAMTWLAARGIERSDTVIIGNSIGGGVASAMARRHQPLGLILVSPFTSLPDAAAANLWWMPARLLVSDRYPNSERLAGLDLPVLVQHGTADNLIPHDQGEKLADIAARGELQSFERSGHALSFERRSAEARAAWILDVALQRER